MDALMNRVTSNNTSECILDALMPANVFLCGAKKQGIGVVKPGADEGRGDGLSHIFGDGRANMAQGPNMIECRLADGANVLVEGKVTVECDIENFYMVGQRD